MEYSNLPISNLSFATPNTKHFSFIDLVNTPRNPIKTIPETSNLPQKDINDKKIIESETFTDKIFAKVKKENLKTKLISSLESTISFWFQKVKFKILNLGKEIKTKAKPFTNSQ